MIDTGWDLGKMFGLKAKGALEKAGEGMGIRITSIEVPSANQLDSAFRNVVRSRAQALIVSPSVLFAGAPTRRRMIELAARHRLPAVYGDEVFVKDGGLMSYWSSIADVLRDSAGMVAKVLRGTKAQDIPVQYPTRFRLVVNLRTARALGLSIPYVVLVQADDVIK